MRWSLSSCCSSVAAAAVAFNHQSKFCAVRAKATCGGFNDATTKKNEKRNVRILQLQCCKLLARGGQPPANSPLTLRLPSVWLPNLAPSLSLSRSTSVFFSAALWLIHQQMRQLPLGVASKKCNKSVVHADPSILLPSPSLPSGQPSIWHFLLHSLKCSWLSSTGSSFYTHTHIQFFPSLF